MKTSKSKNTIVTIALLLVLSMTIFAFTEVNARSPPKIFPTWTFISVSPLTEGVGQTATIVFWCNFLPPTAIGQYGDRWTFTVNVVKPDGTNETLGPIGSDPVGAGYTTYTPTEPGQYLFQAIMANHTIDGGASRGLISPGGVGYWPSGAPSFAGINPVGDIFLSSVSSPQNMTVQTEPIPNYLETPLPSDYWTRPVYDTNRMWDQIIMGEWYAASELNQFGNGGRYNPFSTGPTSAHILWTKQYWDGGVAGGVGSLGSGGPAVSYYSGQSYESYGSQPYMLLNGRLYYSVQTDPREGFYVLDLTTGDIIYYRNSTGAVTGVGGAFAGSGSIPGGIPAFGQVLDMETPNQHGTLAYYWVTSTGVAGKWDMYDDFSGNYICSIGNIPSWVAGSAVQFGAAAYTPSYGLDGSILRYQIANLGTTSSPNYYLQIWNTTQAIMAPTYLTTLGYLPGIQPAPTGLAPGLASGSNTYWMWRPQMNTTYDGSLGYSLNVSIPNIAAFAPGLFGSVSTIRQIIPEDKVIGIYPGSNNGTVQVPGQVWAISLKNGEQGKLLYQYNFTAPAGLGDAADQAEQFSSHDTAYGGMDANASIFWYQNSMYRVWYVYSLIDGHPLWTSPGGPQFEFYGMGSVVIYNNEFIDTGGWGGVVAAYNTQTGAFLWNWTAPSVGQGETPYQYSTTSYGVLSGDGLLYLYSNEHSVNNPIRRDGAIWCINATNGQQIWQLTCWPSGAPILGDGDLFVLDDHDNQIYTYGKGPSAITVDTAMAGIIKGQSFVIKGTVMDTSAGTKQPEIATRFPDGVPAVSDDSESEWMEYVYHQRPAPTNASGVLVSIDVIDPNGNKVNLGTTHSDSSGFYGFTVDPNTLSAGPGTYTIIATFAGSNSYWPSFAESAFALSPAPTVAPTTVPQGNVVTTTDLMTYMVTGVIAIIIAITIVGVLLLRKRS